MPGKSWHCLHNHALYIVEEGFGEGAELRKHIGIDSRNATGSITVYLTLILLIILSLLCTIIEGARVSTAKNFAERALSTSMDSVLAGFYGPLWEEYHILGYYTGEGGELEQASASGEIGASGQANASDEAAAFSEASTSVEANASGEASAFGEASASGEAQGIAAAMSDYMSYTLAPGKDLDPNLTKGSYELYGISVKSVTVGKLRRLTDGQGELLAGEAAEYMKYKEIAAGAKYLLDRMSLLETPQKVSAIYEDKLGAEEELAKLDRDILQLMELLDGIDTSKKGLVLSDGGSLQTKEYFVKKFCSGQPTTESQGINHASVFGAVKGRYIDTENRINGIKSRLEGLEGIASRMVQAEAELAALPPENEQNSEESREQTSAEDNSGQAPEGKNRENTGQAPRKEDGENAEQALAGDTKEQASGEEVINKRELLSRELDSLRAEKVQLTASANSALEELRALADNIMPLIEEAKAVIEHSTGLAAGAREAVEIFEDTLDLGKEGLSAELLEGLESDLAQMKRYASGEEGEGLTSMLEPLDENLDMLHRMRSQVSLCKQSLQAENYTAAGGCLDAAAGAIKRYHIGELRLDYSTLVLDKANDKNPAKELTKALKLGLTGLVADSGTLSDQKLTNDCLPSVEATMQKEDSQIFGILSEFISDIAGNSGDAGSRELFGLFSDSAEMEGILGDTVEKLTEQLLLQEYMKEHFEQYPASGEDITKGRPSALAYEQEYLISGREADEDNLADVIGRIVLLRMVANFTVTLGDQGCQAQALAAATALVGFTGFPVLITIVKTAFLLLWAFSEALADTCALLAGKEVPVIKSRIILTFPELFLINHDFLMTKVSQVEQSGLSLTYGDYLGLFRLLTPQKALTYRAMDLIQENINLRYEDTFLIRNCLYGFSATAEYAVPARFIAIPFIRGYLKHDITGYRFSARAEYSY